MAPPPQGDDWADAYLHRPDCAQAQSLGGMVSDQEALAALAGADVTVPCPVCRPGMVLKPKTPAAHRQGACGRSP
ncbi:DUF6233 domain-containing protein [Streptomyces platensis]|uniref:DUF6233 domain-containing protein n=1 Tax=Streptomyces platensis TaxID=58346 RepID=UPI0034D50570